MICFKPTSRIIQGIQKAGHLFLLCAFLVSTLSPSGFAQSLVDLPKPGQILALSPAFSPVLLKGVTIHPEDPLLFDFIVDNGQAHVTGEALTAETTKLVKYFLAGLAVPEKDLWVNLSPVEQDRVMADALSRTDVGRDMLAQDYILKQVTASLLYPEGDLGRKFWNEIYSRAYQTLGHTEIPVGSFNKVWIVPEDATVYQEGNRAVVASSHLKVMLESDYVAQSRAESQEARGINDSNPEASSDDLAKQVLRDVIVPVLEKEVNEGQNFAPLRQLFQSMVLAGWYKNALKQALLNQVYSDSNKVEGITTGEEQAREKVYAQYLQAYQRGVYNYIKEEADLATGENVSRKYFSGGVVVAPALHPGVLTPATINRGQKARVQQFAGDAAMLSFRMKLRPVEFISREFLLEGDLKRVLDGLAQNRELLSTPYGRLQMKEIAFENGWNDVVRKVWYDETRKMLYLIDGDTGDMFFIDDLDKPMKRAPPISEETVPRRASVVWDEYSHEEIALRAEADRLREAFDAGKTYADLTDEMKKEFEKLSSEDLVRRMEQINAYRRLFDPHRGAAERERDKEAAALKSKAKKIEEAAHREAEKLVAEVKRLEDKVREDPLINGGLIPKVFALDAEAERIEEQARREAAPILAESEKIASRSIEFFGQETLSILGFLDTQARGVLQEREERRELTWSAVALVAAALAVGGGWLVTRPMVSEASKVTTPFAVSELVEGLMTPSFLEKPQTKDGGADQAQWTAWRDRALEGWTRFWDGDSEEDSTRQQKAHAPLKPAYRWIGIVTGLVTAALPNAQGSMVLHVIEPEEGGAAVEVTFGRHAFRISEQNGVFSAALSGREPLMLQAGDVSEEKVREIVGQLLQGKEPEKSAEERRRFARKIMRLEWAVDVIRSSFVKKVFQAELADIRGLSGVSGERRLNALFERVLLHRMVEDMRQVAVDQQVDGWQESLSPQRVPDAERFLKKVVALNGQMVAVKSLSMKEHFRAAIMKARGDQNEQALDVLFVPLYRQRLIEEKADRDMVFEEKIREVSSIKDVFVALDALYRSPISSLTGGTLSGPQAAVPGGIDFVAFVSTDEQKPARVGEQYDFQADGTLQLGRAHELSSGLWSLAALRQEAQGLDIPKDATFRIFVDTLANGLKVAKIAVVSPVVSPVAEKPAEAKASIVRQEDEALMAVGFRPMTVGQHAIRFLRDGRILLDGVPQEMVMPGVKKVFRYGNIFIRTSGENQDVVQVLAMSSDGKSMVALPRTELARFLKMDLKMFDKVFPSFPGSLSLVMGVDLDVAPQHIFLTFKQRGLLGKKKYTVLSIDLGELEIFMAEVSADRAEVVTMTPGGIDLGRGQYLKVIATDAAGMPSFDPVRVQEIRQDLGGVVPMPIGLPEMLRGPQLLGMEQKSVVEAVL